MEVLIILRQVAMLLFIIVIMEQLELILLILGRTGKMEV